MAVLVIAEHDNASLKDATHKTVTAASKIGGDVDILIAGKGVKDVMAAAAKIDGVRAVIGVDHASLERQLSWAITTLCSHLTQPRIKITCPASLQSLTSSKFRL